MLLVLVSGWWWLRADQLRHQQVAVTMQQPFRETLIVQPDDVTLTGTGYRLLGQRSSGERVLVTGSVHHQAELQAWRHRESTTGLAIQGQVSGILPATNFNQFDAATYWRRRGIVNQVRVTGQVTVRPINRAKYWWGLDWWHHQRSRLLHYCDRLPGALRIYALGLFPGGRASETPQELSGLRQLGLLHLFAISGLHVAIGLAVLEWLAIRGRLPSEWWEWGLIAWLPGYAILAGGGSGVVRACVMHGLRLLSRRIHYPIDTLTAWSWAGLWGLSQNPGLFLELGGQLSYGLSLALILLAHERPWWRHGGLTLLGIPSLLTGIYQWHVLSLLANLLVVPLFPIVLLPVTALGTLTANWWPTLAEWCAWLLGRFDEVLRWVSQLPGNLAFGKPAWWVAWGWFLLTWWLYSRPPRQRRVGLSLLLTSYLVVFLAIHYPLTGEVSYFDVGQGDSILLREPFNRRVTLIDVGGHLAFPRPTWAPPQAPTYAATGTVVNYLKSRGITRINELYLTHHDADHIGDLPALLANFHVERISVPAGMETQTAWRHLLRGYPTIPIRALRVGHKASLQVLHPLVAGPADNGGSLALQGRQGGLNFLFMGDLDRVGEQKILTLLPRLHADIIKIGHHGSKTASSPSFLQQVHPRLAVISVGRHNRYGHPDQQTLNTLNQQKIATWSTASRGMIRYTYGWKIHDWQTKLQPERNH